MRKILIMLLTLFCGIALSAQETTSEIQGQVIDDKGNTLHGATVTATHIPTGTHYITTTRKDGRYNLPNVRVGGPYEVRISFVGFQEQKQDSISLLLGQEFKADFTLTPAVTNLSEVVLTTSARQDKVFSNSHTGSQEIISRSQIERLPTINRSLQDFTKLEPTANGLNIGGRSNQYNNLTVDGANFNNSFGLSGTLGGQTTDSSPSRTGLAPLRQKLDPAWRTQVNRPSRR